MSGSSSQKVFASSQYAQSVAENPYHHQFERPATYALLNELSFKIALDAGCGPGIYTEYLANRGAEVSAVDISPEMVERTRTLVPQATVLEHDLREPLPFKNEVFDLALSPLTLHYLKDWKNVFSEFHRVLRP